MIERYGKDYEETIKYALSSIASMMQIGDIIAGVDYGYRLKSDNFDRWESTDGRAILSNLLGIICDHAALDYELFKIYAPLDWFEMYVIKRSRAPKNQKEYECLVNERVKEGDQDRF